VPALFGYTTISTTTVRRDLPFHEDAILEGAASRVHSDIGRFFSKVRLEQAATQDERLRLARELHDGVLQSLTGIALQLETVSRLLDSDPEKARYRLQEIQTLIAGEQRELRGWIAGLSPGGPEPMAPASHLSAALHELCRRAEWQWGTRLELLVGPNASVPRALGDHIYRIVQESLNNIGQHARAQAARVELQVRPDRVEIRVKDDGVGFPFRGSYDLAQLTARSIGPRSLKERIASLHGQLVLTSSPSGSQLEITLPSQRQAWPLPTRNQVSI